MADHHDHSDTPGHGETADPFVREPTLGSNGDEGQSRTELVGVIKDVFGELRQSEIQEFKSLKTALNRLTEATLTQKQKPQTKDKHTMFWNLYKELAVEFDEEFHKKYWDDLDSTLLFAGLFGAISSAFIIQVQPELQPDPKTMLGPSTVIVVVQGLLYFTLFFTLFAALVAVLGRQWLLHYNSVTHRGSIAHRSLERQHKYDALRYWRFHLLMEIPPFLLQLSLLIFAAALSLYLWRIHRALAAIALALTSFGFTFYAVIMFSALTSPDAPFQTTLTNSLAATFNSLAATFNSLAATFKSLGSTSKDAARALLEGAIYILRRGIWFVSSSYSEFMNTVPDLPLFNAAQSPDDAPLSPAPTGSTPSPPVVNGDDHEDEARAMARAIVWALETSTNAKLVHAAADVIPTIVWPINRDLQSPLKRLHDVFTGCFNGDEMHPGMQDRATSCIQAFSMLEMVNQNRLEVFRHVWNFEADLWESHPNKELTTVTTLFQNRKADRNSTYLIPTCVISRWALRVISAAELPEVHLEWVLKNFRPDSTSLGDRSLLAEFVFCINSFFECPDVHALSVIDRSKECVDVTTKVFEHLGRRLAELNPLNAKIAQKIVEKILGFKDANGGRIARLNGTPECLSAVYEFCSLPNLELPTVSATLQLVRIHRNPPRVDLHLKEITWVFNALGRFSAWGLQNIDLIGDFLQVLVACRNLTKSPSPAALRTILWGLASDVADGRTRSFAALILFRSQAWFEDAALGPILRQQNGIWTLLGACSHLNRTAYTSLGDVLSNISEWKPLISEDPFGWLSNLSPLLAVGSEQQKATFCAVLSRVWDIAAADGEERMLVMAFTSLGNVWDQFDPLHSKDVDYILKLVRCTVETTFCARVARDRLLHPSDTFREVNIIGLEDAVAHGVERWKATATTDAKYPVNRAVENHVVEILSKLMTIIKGELQNQPLPENKKEARVQYWKGLKEEFEGDIVALRAEVKIVALLESLQTDEALVS
ncbi:hypothetical protein DFH09DRAFT_1353790 [Mycena vulgaris]|nr:hypothetical protein DFH09DRAFT_1353790 [Mycena vulgaris]